MTAISNETKHKATQERQKQARLKTQIYFLKREDHHQKQLL